MLRCLINRYKYLKEGYKEGRAKLFSVVPSDGTRGKGDEMVHRKYFLFFFFTVGVTKHWSSLLREVVESLPFEIFKRHLDMVLDNVL